MGVPSIAPDPSSHRPDSWSTPNRSQPPPAPDVCPGSLQASNPCVTASRLHGPSIPADSVPLGPSRVQTPASAPEIARPSFSLDFGLLPNSFQSRLSRLQPRHRWLSRLQLLSPDRDFRLQLPSPVVPVSGLSFGQLRLHLRTARLRLLDATSCPNRPRPSLGLRILPSRLRPPAPCSNRNRLHHPDGPTDSALSPSPISADSNAPDSSS